MSLWAGMITQRISWSLICKNYIKSIYAKTFGQVYVKGRCNKFVVETYMYKKKVKNMESDTKNYLGPPKSLIDSIIMVD